MKLAEALAERSELHNKIKLVSSRISSAAQFVEGEEPPEDAQELLEELKDAISRYYALVALVNLRNAVTEIEPGVTITQAMAERARLTALIKLLHQVASDATPGNDPYSRGRRRAELPVKTALRVKDLHAEADQLSRQHRELDAKIQQANWDTEL